MTRFCSIFSQLLLRAWRFPGTETVRPLRGTNGTTRPVSRTGGEAPQLPKSRSPFPSRAAARTEAPVRPLPAPSESWPRDNS
jgi:hypothetical protein